MQLTPVVSLALLLLLLLLTPLPFDDPVLLSAEVTTDDEDLMAN